MIMITFIIFIRAEYRNGNEILLFLIDSGNGEFFQIFSEVQVSYILTPIPSISFFTSSESKSSGNDGKT